jgi:hypothetical protein
MGLHAILPILDSVHILIKCAQSFNLFMYDFINVMKIYQLTFANFIMIHITNLTTLLLMS